LCDYLNRHIVSLVHQWRLDVADVSGNYNGPKGGDFSIYKPSQQVLERSSCVIVGIGEQDPAIEIRFTVTLPANGRSINGIKARDLMVEHLPRIMEKGLLWRNQDQLKLKNHIRSVEVQEALRNKLSGMELVAFVGNGAILPRASGADPRPMDVGAVKFQSPPSLQVTIDSGIVDDKDRPIVITGMGIPRGITVITGGGFHGKSTLLEALQFGIYNVIPGDGRQLVVTEPGAFKIRAEDGRNVENVDITPFINQLPGGMSTSSFSTADASGSTSMAANIQEALEIGATSLIIDEDTSATNFLIRDGKMHELVRSEPITPLVSKVQALFSEKGVSTIIVVGGCGDYLNVSHTVIGMESYLPHDWTTRAHQIASKYPNAAPTVSSYGNTPSRILTLLELGSKPPTAHGVEKISFRYDRFKVETGDRLPEVDLAFLEQFVEPGQANTCVEALQHIGALPGASKLARDWVKELQVLSSRNGVNLRGNKQPFGNLAFARPLEVLSVVNRVRTLKASVATPLVSFS
jgi:predicted ABC-class ATPase